MNTKDIRNIIEQEANAILNIPISEEYNKEVDLIVNNVYKKNGKLIISGMGKAGQIGQNMATTFCSTGNSGNIPSSQ